MAKWSVTVHPPGRIESWWKIHAPKSSAVTVVELKAEMHRLKPKSAMSVSIDGISRLAELLFRLGDEAAESGFHIGLGEPILRIRHRARAGRQFK